MTLVALDANISGAFSYFARGCSALKPFFPSPYPFPPLDRHFSARPGPDSSLASADQTSFLYKEGYECGGQPGENSHASEITARPCGPGARRLGSLGAADAGPLRQRRWIHSAMDVRP